MRLKINGFYFLIFNAGNRLIEIISIKVKNRIQIRIKIHMVILIL
jgi:hypothetical protein